MPRRLAPLTFVLLASVIGCRTAGPAARPSPAPTATPAPADRLEIRWVKTAAEYEALARQAYQAAQAHVEREAAGRAPGTWGVILDADETAISNLPYQEANPGPLNDAAWKTWVESRAAEALPGAREFLARVRALGGRIAIVTNRSQAACADTAAVFDTRGLAYDLMLCRTSESSKNPRFEAVEKGTPPSTLPPLAIVAYVGDNIQDFPNLSQAIRDRGGSAFADFGRRYFIIPNPMYGSWLR
jgi:5'-nucleotidase (lipoprotein e(P4) family)